MRNKVTKMAMAAVLVLASFGFIAPDSPKTPFSKNSKP